MGITGPGRFQPGDLSPLTRAALVHKLAEHFDEVALGALRLHEAPDSVVVIRWSIGGEEIEIKVPCEPKELWQAYPATTPAFEALYEKLALAMRRRLGIDEEEEE